MKTLNQLILNFDYDQNFKDQDFYVSKSNENSFLLLNKWPKWDKNLFTWLDKCESKLGFNQFKNYETRIYAFLSERYISYWFKKYSKCHELPWTFFEND